jgi:DNA-3-methyladenine glycosylase
MAQGRPLPVEVYLQPTVEVARQLLGHLLVVQTPEGWAGGRIVETEAYCQEDPASHSYRGLTERNAPMFGPPATAYVYLIYGLHECFNVVCQPVGIGEAVLIRAIEPCFGLEWMRHRRPHVPDYALCRGPGNLCRALGITRAINGESLLTGRVRILQGDPIPDARIQRTPRVGVRQAKEHLWRFCEMGNPCVSHNRKL